LALHRAVRLLGTNNGSGMHGILQAYRTGKVASITDDWRANAATQIKRGLGYVTGRYKTPCRAWSHFQSNGNC